MELMNTQKANPTKGKAENPKFVVQGQSEVFPGPHYLNIHGGFLPAQGGHGRLSEERCREMIRRFDTREEAQAYVDQNNAVATRNFTASVEEVPE